ncbi:MAG TPA: LytTR family DNA-binding domain-containing protein [Longimicrobium sp.]|jgi:two-component system LytT family response regulator
MDPDERITAVIVEDEPLALEKLRRLLDDEPDVQVVAVCDEGIEAARTIAALRPDVVFLDVQIPGIDGFEVIERVGTRSMPVTVFVTAVDRHAVRAFEVQAIDYLLKPYDAPRFAAALDRAREVIRTRRLAQFQARLQGLLETVRAPREYPPRFMVRSGGEYVFVRADDIEWVESADNYVSLHAGRRAYLLRETMGGMEEKLDPRRFARVRASAIVNFDCVAAVRPWSGTEYELVLRDGTRLLTSRRYRDRLQPFFTR